MSDSTATAFIYGVPYRSDAEEIGDFFAKCIGGVKGVRLLGSHTDGGTHGGVGFVCFASEDDLQRALNRRRFQLHGREIGIESARSTPRLENRSYPRPSLR